MKTSGLPHSLDICISPDSPTEMFSLAELDFLEWSDVTSEFIPLGRVSDC